MKLYNYSGIKLYLTLICGIALTSACEVHCLYFIWYKYLTEIGVFNIFANMFLLCRNTSAGFRHSIYIYMLILNLWTVSVVNLQFFHSRRCTHQYHCRDAVYLSLVCFWGCTNGETVRDCVRSQRILIKNKLLHYAQYVQCVYIYLHSSWSSFVYTQVITGVS